MKRRLLIKLAAFSLSGLALPALWFKHLRADDVFDELFGDPRVAAHIGKIHHARDKRAAARGRKLIARPATQPRSTLKQHLLARAEADLADLDVVVVDGWVMARSEADLCAAVHLDRSLA